jgi:AcrR family transcriptional regulator
VGEQTAEGSAISAVGGGRGTAAAGHRPADTTTRLLLIRTAERLFAERGIQAVPLSDIHNAAGQRNASAINYHFGGKEKLVRAIIEHRAATTNARRLELLRAADSAGHGHDVRTLVNVLVRPLADEIAAGTHYAGFLAHMITERDLDRPVRLNSDPVWSNASSVGQRLQTALPDLDRGVLTMRFQLVLDLGIHALATYQSVTRRAPERLPPLDVYVGQLVDAMTGLLIAPAHHGHPSAG